MDRPIGLIAGEGRLPLITARGIHAAGQKVACVGLRDQFDPVLPGQCERFKQAGIIQLGKWIRTLRRWDVEEAVMVGRVKKVRMHDPLRLVRQLPDWRAARVWYHKLRHDRRNDTLLKAVADELQEGGITLIDSTKYIPDHLADEGVLTRTQPTAEQMAEIEFGLATLRGVIELDVGQAIAIKERDILAVEAVEGTDEMIRRAGQLCRRGKWVLLKAAGPEKDMRFDVPTIGVKTIANLRAAGAACLAVEAGKVILVDKPAVLKAADAAKIAIIGIRLGE